MDFKMLNVRAASIVFLFALLSFTGCVQTVQPLTPPVSGTVSASTDNSSAQSSAATSNSPLPPLVPPGRGGVYSVGLAISPDKTAYPSGELVQLNVTVMNNSSLNSQPVTINPYPPRIDLEVPVSPATGATDLWRLSNSVIKTFPAGTGTKTFIAGENITYQLTWDQKDNDGKQVSPCWYFFDYKLQANNGSQNWGSGGAGKVLLIQYPQGAMKKTIQVNQSKRIENLTLSMDGGGSRSIDLVLQLKQVVLNDMGASFLVVASSPSHPTPDYNGIGWAGSSEAEYIVDGVTKYARSANSQVTGNGVQLRWGDVNNKDYYLDPIPADAKQLVFIMTGFANWKGPWQFQVPLR